MKQIPDIARCSRCMDTRPKRDNETTVSDKRGLVDSISNKWIRCEKCERGYMRLVHLYTTPALVKASIKESQQETRRLNRSYGGMQGWGTRVTRGVDTRTFGERLRVGFNYLNGGLA